jgi:signal transduction histidine kinase
MRASKIVTLVFITLIFNFAMAQKKEVIDSLWLNYKSSTNDSIKLKAANFLAFHYIFRQPERADSILTSTSTFAKQENLNFGLTELTNTRGIYYDVLGQKDSSKVFFQRALKLSQQYKYPTIEVMCINNLGMFCWNNGQFKEAINYFYQALEFSQEHTPDKDKGESIYLNNIGLIYQELKQYKKAIPFHEKALDIRKKYNLDKDIAQSFNNLAICHQNTNDLNKAKDYIKQAIKFANTANQPKLYHQYHNTLGNILNLQKEYSQAELAYKEALNLPKEYQTNISDKFSTYSYLIQLYYNSGQLESAQTTISKAQSLIEQDSTLYNFSETFYINSAKTYYALQDNTKAEKYFDQYLKLKDSLFSQENANALSNVEAKLKTKEKEAELAETKAELLEEELKVKRQNLFIYGGISAIIIIIVLSYFIIKSKQLKNTKMQKEAELQTALAKIELKNKLEEQRIRISRDLHDNIGSQLTFVISGLQYIQYQKKLKFEEVKSKLSQLSQFTQQTIHELRDTIWAMNKEEIQFSDLLDRVVKFVDQANLKEKISVSIPEENNLESIKFNAVEGIQIYRFIQEAITNAIKHAGSNLIELNVKLEDEYINIQIIDDGKGFDPNTIEFGNGLNNLKQRAQQLKAQLDINSQINSGTNITLALTIPINT